MANQLGEATIAIRATLDKLDGDLAAARGKVEGAMSKIGSSVQTMGKVALAGVAGAAVAAGAAVIGFAAKAIPAASNLNEALNATNVVFGDAAATVQEFGKTAAESAGLSESAFNQMASVTGAMLQNYGLDADQAADATVSLAQRAADMASIFNTDVEDAMGAINAAMRGEADPIERFGVSMNAAAVEAQALAMGFEKVDGAFSETEMTQARLALLMQQTDKIAGDFVNTSDDLANKTRINEARWENFLAQIGQVGLPIMGMFQGLLATIGEQVLPIVTSALETIQPVVEAVSYAIGEFVDDLVAGKDPLQAVEDLLARLAIALGGNSETADAVREAFGKVVEAVQGVIDAVAPYIEMAKEWISENIEISDVLIALGLVIASVVIPAIVSVIAAAAPIILTFMAIVAVVALLRKAWDEDWGGIQGKAQAVSDWLKENIPAAIEWIKTKWVEIWGNVTKNFAEAKAEITRIGQSTIDTLKRIFSGGVDWGAVGRAIIQGIARGISSALSIIKDAAKNAAQAALDAAKNFLGIKSPSAVFADQVGKQMGAGMTLGFERSLTGFERVLGSVDYSLDLGLTAGMAPAEAAIGAGGMTVQINQQFYGPTDAATVERAADDGLTRAARRLGYR